MMDKTGITGQDVDRTGPSSFKPCRDVIEVGQDRTEREGASGGAFLLESQVVVLPSANCISMSVVVLLDRPRSTSIDQPLH